MGMRRGQNPQRGDNYFLGGDGAGLGSFVAGLLSFTLISGALPSGGLPSPSGLFSAPGLSVFSSGFFFKYCTISEILRFEGSRGASFFRRR